MANHPKKMADPTEAALSAIQEALNIHNEDEQPTRPTESADLFSAPAEQGDAAAATTEPSDKEAISARELPEVAARAANDDQQSIGQILHALQRRPARTSYFVAALFSGAWRITRRGR
jgi:hypothetical protein